MKFQFGNRVRETDKPQKECREGRIVASKKKRGNISYTVLMDEPISYPEGKRLWGEPGELGKYQAFNASESSLGLVPNSIHFIKSE